MLQYQDGGNVNGTPRSSVDLAEKWKANNSS
jgi:hypothetical protein